MSSSKLTTIRTINRPAAEQFKFGHLVQDVSKMRRTVMDQVMRPLGVTRSQWSVLGTISLGSNDGLTQVDLARLLEVGKVTIGDLIDQLEAMGHVVRMPDAIDRRMKRIFITDQGFDTIEDIILVTSKINKSLLLDVSSEHQQVVEEVLYKVKQNLKIILK